MMSTGSSSKLSEQQQRRITDNFRAAKAKLAQKRPHSPSPSSPFPPRPLISSTLENDSPMEFFHGGSCAQAAPNFRCYFRPPATIFFNFLFDIVNIV